MVTSWQHPLAGQVDLVSSPIKLSLTPVRRDMPPPLLGQHTEEVLSQLLALDDQQLEQLRQNKII